LLAYAALGIAGGFISLAFSRGLLVSRALFKRLPHSTLMVQPVMGGILIGGLIVLSPAIMGVGYESVDLALNGGLVLEAMVLLCALKIVGTIASYSSGNAGGIFAPSLYIGAMAGGAIGTLVHRYAPFPTAEPGAYALVGMGALFAGIIRAPMTSVFMIFEITQDYQILVPLMVANLLSFIIARRFQPEPIYHALLHQDGIHLPGASGPAMPGSWTAAAAMVPAPALVEEDALVQTVLNAPGTRAWAAVLVGRSNEFVGVVTRATLVAAAASGQATDRLGSLLQGAPLHLHPDHAADVVIERILAGGGMAPVVSRECASQVLGVVTVDTVARSMGKGAV
jgi:CIC family chloride channel protein